MIGCCHKGGRVGGRGIVCIIGRGGGGLRRFLIGGMICLNGGWEGGGGMILYIDGSDKVSELSFFCLT